MRTGSQDIEFAKARAAKMDGAAPRERPIVFSPESVRGILAGAKTQTRRPVETPEATRAFYSTGPGSWTKSETGDLNDIAYDVSQGADGNWHFLVAGDQGYDGPHECPYGSVGDRLWVREAFSVAPTAGCTFGDAMMGRKLTVTYGADGAAVDLHGFTGAGPDIRMDYPALDYPFEKYGVKRHARHMPRSLCRLTLAVTGVRVERLQAITEADALAEYSQCPIRDFDPPLQGCFSEREAFAQIWERINGKNRPWAANPYVWVISFARVQEARPC